MDQAPVIEAFDYDLELVGQGFEAAITVRATDDLGVARLEFVFASDGGVDNTYSHDCAGQAVCEIGTRTPLSPGEWRQGHSAQ